MFLKQSPFFFFFYSLKWCVSDSWNARESTKLFSWKTSLNLWITADLYSVSSDTGDSFIIHWIKSTLHKWSLSDWLHRLNLCFCRTSQCKWLLWSQWYISHKPVICLWTVISDADTEDTSSCSIQSDLRPEQHFMVYWSLLFSLSCEWR